MPSARRSNIAGALLVLALAVAAAPLWAYQPADGAAEPIIEPAGELPRKSSESPREQLRQLGVDDSRWQSFAHNQPLSVGEEETLSRILFHLPRIGRANIERRQEKSLSWQEVAAEPDVQRAKVFKVVGRATRVVWREVTPEIARLVDFDHYYQVSLKLDDAPNPVLVCTREVPEAWLSTVPLEERTSCFGLFLKLGQAEGESAQLVFAALRMAWHPERVDASLGVTEGLKWLGKLGVDVGLFESVRIRNRQPIGAAERECFYQLMAALSRASPQEFKQRAGHDLELAPLLTDPAAHHGEAMLLRGRARRVRKVALGETDRDIRERFGIDHYYQVDVFVPLESQRIQFSNGPKDRGGPIFENSFLVTLCVLKIPEGLEESKPIDVDVRLPVVFFKVWEFPSKYVEQYSGWKFQPSPLLFGVEPVVLSRSKASPSRSFVAPSVLALVVALAGIWYGLWQAGKGKKWTEKLMTEK